MAEGAGALLLEDWEHAERRGAEIYAEVLGYGASNDAHHMAQPEPEATGVAAMMAAALERAGVEPRRASATSTRTAPRRRSVTRRRRRRSRRSSATHAYDARGLVDEVDDGAHLRSRRRDRGDHVRARAARRRAAADDQLPRARPRVRPRLRAERGAAQRRSTSRSRTRWGSAATTAAFCSAAPHEAHARPSRDAPARDSARAACSSTRCCARPGSTPPIENTPNRAANPLVELPVRAEDIVAGVDLCIVTHLHSDHFDDAADAVLPRDLPILTQPESADELTRPRVHERRHRARLGITDDARPARHRRDRRGDGPGVGLDRRRRLHRRRHDLVRRGRRGASTRTGRASSS